MRTPATPGILVRASKPSVNVWLDEDVHDALVLRAKSLSTSKAEYVRALIVGALNAVQQPGETSRQCSRVAGEE